MTMTSTIAPVPAAIEALSACNTRFSVIAVQNYAGSGSLFLQSLLDGHPQVLALPGPFGIQYYVSWAIHMESANAIGMDYPKMKDWVFKFFGGLYELPPNREFGLTELGESMTENSVVERHCFERAFDIVFEKIAQEERLPPSTAVNPASVNGYRSVCLRAIYIAYAFCAGQDLSRKRFILYPSHSAPMRDVGALCADFEDVRFVHMVREPVSTLDSMQRRLYDLTTTSLPNIDVFSCVMNQIYYDRAPQAPVCGVPLYSIYPYPTAKQGRSIAVRLEDVHLRSRKTLECLCEFLGLEWSDTLLASTFAEKKWWNLPGLRRVSGFSASIVSRKPSFGLLDQWRFKTLAAPISGQFGYLPAGEHRSTAAEWLALALSILFPFELEYRCFSMNRYHTIVSRLSEKLRPLARMKSVLLVALLPFLILRDYFEHRLTIVRGFFLNRAPSTRFVELMKS